MREQTQCGASDGRLTPSDGSTSRGADFKPTRSGCQPGGPKSGRRAALHPVALGQSQSAGVGPRRKRPGVSPRQQCPFEVLSMAYCSSPGSAARYATEQSAAWGCRVPWVKNRGHDGDRSMKTWSGHDPETATALLHILDGAATGASAPSDFELHFASACELWSAAASGELSSRLPANPAHALRDASAAFRYMGAALASDALLRAAVLLSRESTPDDRRAQLAVLADRLISGVEKLDELLTDHANGLLRRRGVAPGPRQASRHPPSSPRAH